MDEFVFLSLFLISNIFYNELQYLSIMNTMNKLRHTHTHTYTHAENIF